MRQNNTLLRRTTDCYLKRCLMHDVCVCVCVCVINAIDQTIFRHYVVVMTRARLAPYNFNLAFATLLSNFAFCE